MKRTALSKKTRFEVFKRDSFTCQYCGATPPGVVLHVDHILAVVNGGKNDIDNLVTACQACNQGKSDRDLADIPQTLQSKAEEILEREAQIIGYQRIVEEKRLRINDEAMEVADCYSDFFPGYFLTDKSIVTVKRFIDKLGFHQVYAAMEKACANTKIRRDQEFKYFCGICWNLIREADDVN